VFPGADLLLRKPPCPVLPKRKPRGQRRKKASRNNDQKFSRIREQVSSRPGRKRRTRDLGLSVSVKKGGFVRANTVSEKNPVHAGGGAKQSHRREGPLSSHRIGREKGGRAGGCEICGMKEKSLVLAGRSGGTARKTLMSPEVPCRGIEVGRKTKYTPGRSPLGECLAQLKAIQRGGAKENR